MTAFRAARWASGATAAPPPNIPTEFESLVQHLGLTKRPDLWPHNDKLRAFAKKFRKTRYVPEFLLTQLGLDNEVDL